MSSPSPALALRRPPRSLALLLVETVLDVLLALLIGFLGGALHLYFYAGHADRLAPLQGLRTLGVPLGLIGLQGLYDEESGKAEYSHDREYLSAPPDDQGLRDWYATQPQFQILTLKRQTFHQKPHPRVQRIHLVLRGPPGQKEPAVPWSELGYKLTPRQVFTPWDETGLFQSHPYFFAQEMLLVQVVHFYLGFLVVGLLRVWRNRRLGSSRPPLWGERPLRAVLLGVGMGVLLGGLFWAYDLALVRWFVPPWSTASPWRFVPSFPDEASRYAVVLPAFLLGAPIAQELFFHGGLLVLWTAAGRPLTGIIVTTLLYATLRVDYYGPLALIGGLSSGWLFLYSRSLLAPIISFVLVHLTVLLMAYGAIPLPDDPAGRLAGTWRSTDTQANLFMVFERGGPIEMDLPQGVETLPLTGAAIPPGTRPMLGRYEFLDRDHIQVEQTFRAAGIGPLITTRARLRLTYHGDELTLTQPETGLDWHFRRSP